MDSRPALGAGLAAWVAWVDRVAPYRGTPTVRGELVKLTTYRDREFAAVAAEYWFRSQARDRGKRRALPRQRGFEY